MKRQWTSGHPRSRLSSRWFSRIFSLESCPGGYNLIMADDGNQKTYRWISSLSKRFSLVEMIATGIVYVKDNRTDTYQPFISENGKYCKYNKDLGKLTEL